MSQVVISARKREVNGSTAVARLRREGRVPGVMYGGKKEALSIDMDALAFSKSIKNISESTIVKLDFGTESHEAFVKDTQWDIISGKVLHVDFYEVEKGKMLRAHVPLHITGSAKGLRTGGIFENPLHEIEVECLPRDLPESIDVDVSELDTNESIHVRDLKLGKDVKILSSGDQVIALVKFAKSEGAGDEVAAEAGAEG